MYGLDMINTSVLGALGCDMNTFLRYFPAAETMYSLLVALAIGLILLGWVWNLFKNYGLGLGVDAEDPVKLTAKAILFIVLAYYADEIVNIALTIGGTPYAWILSSELPSLDFASFNSVLLTIIGVCANGGVALIVLILTLILAWNYITPATPAFTELTQDFLLSNGAVGKISIPAIGVKNYYLWEGETTASMKKGLGHFTSTSVWNGNVAVCGHNRGAKYVIGSIKDLDAGDKITYTTSMGTRTYLVETVTKISSSDWSYLSSTTDNRITLFTCVAGDSSQRWCVQAVQAS